MELDPVWAFKDLKGIAPGVVLPLGTQSSVAWERCSQDFSLNGVANQGSGHGACTHQQFWGVVDTNHTIVIHNLFKKALRPKMDHAARHHDSAP